MYTGLQQQSSACVYGQPLAGWPSLQMHLSRLSSNVIADNHIPLHPSPTTVARLYQGYRLLGEPRLYRHASLQMQCATAV